MTGNAIHRVVALAGCLLAGCLATTRARGDSVVGNDPLQIDVIVLNFDPLVPGRVPRPLHAVLGWNDPRRLAANFARNIRDTSGGFVQYNIAEWRDVDDIPIKVDGFRYGVEEYLANWRSGSSWHAPDTADYVQLLNDQGIPSLISTNVVDEVWLFGAPYFGYWESSMAGPDAFYINGPSYPQVDSDRPFAVMGFNYERGDAEMMHSLGHRIESSVSRVFGGWDIVHPRTDWDRFTANYGQTAAGPYGVGSVHFPANARQDYEYGSLRRVESTASDWLSYPNLGGETRLIDADAWNYGHDGYMRYWLDHLPDAPGLHPDTSRTNNWWKYVYDWTSYELDGTPINVPEPSTMLLLLAGAIVLRAWPNIVLGGSR